MHASPCAVKHHQAMKAAAKYRVQHQTFKGSQAVHIQRYCTAHLGSSRNFESNEPMTMVGDSTRLVTSDSSSDVDAAGTAPACVQSPV